MEYRLQLDSQNDIERAIKSPPRRTVEKPEEEIDKEVVQGEEDVKNVEIDKDVKEIFQPEKRNDTECNRRDEAVVEKEKIIEQVFNTINTEREIIRSNLSTINQAEPTLLNTTESPSAQERTTLLQNVFNDVFRYETHNSKTENFAENSEMVSENIFNETEKVDVFSPQAVRNEDNVFEENKYTQIYETGEEKAVERSESAVPNVVYSPTININTNQEVQIDFHQELMRHKTEIVNLIASVQKRGEIRSYE